MKHLKPVVLLAVVMLAAVATPALAKRSFDVCINPATDVKSQDNLALPGAFATAAANIYPGGTIPAGGVPSCSTLGANLVVGTFYANAALQLALPAAPDVQAFVTWHFDLSPVGTFVTVGPVPFPPGAGGPASYPQTVSGASGPFPSRGTATVTALSPDGFQFRITLP